MSNRIVGISSMATRQLLGELAGPWNQRGGPAVEFESVGGVDAAKRVRDGEAFDVVVLAADAIDKLAEAGRLVDGSTLALAHSSVAIAVKSGSPRPPIDSESALREAVQKARKLACSTGPSGTALEALFARWGIVDEIRGRLVRPPPGTPVGALLARGEVELGFQQLSEMMSIEGIEVIGPMPPGLEIVTTFSGAVCAASAQPEAARALLEFLASPAVAQAVRRNGMAPA